MRKYKHNGYQVQVDLSNQILDLRIPPDKGPFDFNVRRPESFEDDRKGSRGIRAQVHEPDLFSTPLNIAAGEKPFISSALLMAKAKQFDDGLYATLEYLCQRGCNSFMGKKRMLTLILQVLNDMDKTNRSPEIENCQGLIGAALELGGTKSEISSRAITVVKKIKLAFLANPLKSKPISFYTWTEELGHIFQQDRLLQQKLEEDTIRPFYQSITLNPEILKTYLYYLKFIQKITNPFPPEYRDLSKISVIEKNIKYCLFPPSRSFETELIKEIFRNSAIPPDFNLVDTLIQRIQSGKINGIPEKKSGWYDHQFYALVPLVIPEKMPEAQKLSFHESYKKELLNLFKSAIALTRETHIKQLEIPPAGAALQPASIDIYPRITIEPLASHYLRRAQSYGFVRQLLEKTFNTRELKESFRQIPDGKVNMTLGEELAWIESLFYGAYQCVAREIGMPLDSDVLNRGIRQNKHDMQTIQKWKSALKKDPDLGRDLRMMVPVFYDIKRKKIKVWVMMGFTQKPLDIRFKKKPVITVTDTRGKPIKIPVKFKHERKQLIYPVSAEIYVKKPLNRQEFRKLCDKYKTRSKILNALRDQ